MCIQGCLLTQPPRKNVWHFDAAHVGYPARGYRATARSFAQPWGLRHGGDHPGGNLAISATRTLTVLNGFREMVGTTLPGVPTPHALLGSVYVEQATGVFTAT